MNRMVGGTFGIAVLGAMVATLGRSKIDELLPALPASARGRIADALGSGAAPHGVSAQIIDAGQSAFVYSLQYGLRLGSIVALLGAGTAWVLIAPHVKPAAGGAEAGRAPAPGPAAAPAPNAAAEAEREPIHV